MIVYRIKIQVIPMSATVPTLRQKLHQLADQLPADATWEDVIEEVRFRRAVESGIAAADRGAFASELEVREAFAKWGVRA